MNCFIPTLKGEATMGLMDDFKRWARGDEDKNDDFEDISTPKKNQSKVDDEGGVSVTEFRRNNRVVNINATTQLSVVLVKPEKFENAAEVADHLINRRTVILNLEQTNKDVSRRIVDFLSGVTYAQDGKIKMVANNTYMITPYNVDIMGDLIDELENNGLYI
jgi:cell division inhibitor SepF